ncbi:DUF4956 domain-containing protein [Nocardioides sp. URHA0020]|uniref:DUF4956 domain-containing protein n=1 Tax=Nocardioides sp. URHA0020 TaxID=1380392 RepID=UPI0006882E50|nr:DUF4956 domain-containing protein [Nocardioides sp. URHA0020]
MTSTALIGLGIDVLALFVLVGWLYRRRAAAPEMTMVFVTLNIGLLAALTAITAGHFPAGVGFGLFGLLSLVRLRSAAFSVKDVSYTFCALVLALVNGLPDRHLGLVVVLNVLVLAAVWLVDDSKTRRPTRVLRMTLDRALVDADAVRSEVTARLGRAPIAVVVEQVDFVRDTTVVAVRHEVEEGWATLMPSTGPEEIDSRA